MDIKKISPLILILLLGWVPNGSGFSIDVDPTAHELTVPQGGSRAGKISVKNVSKEPVEVNSNVMDWVYDAPAGSKKISPAGTTPFSASKWLTYSPAKFTLQPGQVREVNYSVSLPADAAGGYYSIVMFGAGVAKAKTNQQGISVDLNLQMGSLFLVEAEKTQIVKGTIKDLKILSNKADQPIEIEATFKNEGNVRINAQGRLSIMDSNKNAVGWTKFPSMKTLPGQQWSVKASWAGLSKGKYHMVATFELAPGTVIIKERDVSIE